MKAKLALVVGAAGGYVLGTRAGRARYEQISATAGRLWTNPTVQQKVDQARDKATDLAADAGSQAAVKLKEAASAAKGTVNGSEV